MTKAGKRIRKIREEAEKENLWPFDKAVAFVKAQASAKFDETVEMAINLGVDPKHADQMVRGVCDLPYGSGGKVRIAAFARGDKAEEAKKAGADIVGAEELVEEVSKGKIDFDKCVATPDMMSLVGRLGKVLGPRGLMPNPKVGTVSPDIAKMVERIKGGAVEFRVEKAGIIHAGIGRAAFPEKNISANATAFLSALLKAKPSGVKGVYIKKITLSSTMGVGIKVDPKSAIAATEALSA